MVQSNRTMMSFYRLAVSRIIALIVAFDVAASP